MSAADLKADRPSERPAPIARLLRPVRGYLSLAVLLSGAGAMLMLLPLAGIAEIARLALRDGAVSAGAASSELQGMIRQIATASLISLFIGMALVMAGELAAHLADNRLTRHLRLAATSRLAQVPLGWFSDRASGEVKQAMQDDIATLHELTAHLFTTLGRCAGAILVSVVYLLAIDWRMAILSLLPFAGFHLVVRAARRAAQGEALQDFVAGQARINSAVVAFVDGIPVVKAFGASGRAHRGYAEAVDAFLDAFLRFTHPLIAPLANANAMIAPASVAGMALVAGTLFVGLGWIAPVDVLPFLLVAPGLSAPLMLLGFISHGVTSGTGAAQRVQALLETPVLAQPEPGRRALPTGAEIRFEAVSYAYDPRNAVLSDVSLVLKPGTVTALVGPSGAGKSTLARLLLRFFDPSGGRITLGGADLRQIESRELYRRIGFVLQDVRLIQASLHENIALGRPSATRLEVEAAARAALIHDRILRLPRGYDSIIGEDAVLSGGEQQRVSLARAVLLDPPVLVLDEATAAADAESEAAIQDALSRFARGRTLLVIAHRLDTVMQADSIVVLEDGAVREQGSHAALLALQGRYARLWSAGAYEERLAAAGRPC